MLRPIRFLRKLFHQCLPFTSQDGATKAPSVVAPTVAPPVVEKLRPVQTTKHKKRRKKSIPKSVRLAVWCRYIGEHVGVTKCPVCKTNDIGQMRFEVAHVIAEARGGTMNIENLRPVCPTCNRSMGTTHLEEFRKRFFEMAPVSSPPRKDPPS